MTTKPSERLKYLPVAVVVVVSILLVALVEMYGQPLSQLPHYRNLAVTGNLAVTNHRLHTYLIGGAIGILVSQGPGVVRSCVGGAALLLGIAIISLVVSVSPAIPVFYELEALGVCGWGTMLGTGLFPSPATARFRELRKNAYIERQYPSPADRGTYTTSIAVMQTGVLIVIAGGALLGVVVLLLRHDPAVVPYAACGFWGILASLQVDRLVPITAMP